MESPVPDTKTLETIKDSRAPIDYVPYFAWATGTTYKICNATHCTVYHENFSANWIGEGRLPREGILPVPIDEGTGGGGVSGDFGGMGGGSSWWDGGTGGGDPFSGTGTVVVSDPENVQ
ncbi:hypothetical protein [Stenotrophomonas maltophilia]|uniref:hypothetical protein n=1 Tax=Stenotrophomonas maltophilia TaxID=40324 RepID=UPI0012DB733E|nr:hypothetical protein [Stenotrophomonas maltophilia]